MLAGSRPLHLMQLASHREGSGAVEIDRFTENHSQQASRGEDDEILMSICPF